MPSLLLHCCCAPCASAILERLLDDGLTPVLFFSNSNIAPREEHDHRLHELRTHAQRLHLTLIEDPYDHDDWLQYIKGKEDEPERGARCLECFKYRLLRAARQASELHLPTFATTLASSRWKRLDQIDDAGAWAESQTSATFLARNWRKGGLQERRNALLRQYGFYNQLWCGCEFSRRDRDIPPAE